MVKRFVGSVLITAGISSLLLFLLGMSRPILAGHPVNILELVLDTSGGASLFSIPPALFGGLVYWIYKRKQGTVIKAWIPGLISAVIVVIPPLVLLVVAFSSSSAGNSDGMGMLKGAMSIAAPCVALIAAIFGAGVGQR